ncbi:MAG: hypothetical protein ACOZCL_08135 [Bacillota bacterium]
MKVLKTESGCIVLLTRNEAAAAKIEEAADILQELEKTGRIYVFHSGLGILEESLCRLLDESCGDKV